ncbi:unnamed protein product [Linum trigynum]|uniref:Uncharacterized protein n=1 Tax=Linum trigynum TaxID=586398 RepID=A0AAV2FFG7_9ROSI
MATLSHQWEGPWLCGGDFNEVLDSDEKEGGRAVNVAAMAAFKDCLLVTGLQDLGFQGHKFTWVNNRATGGLSRNAWTIFWHH